jgi:hypothetical protein
MIFMVNKNPLQGFAETNPHIQVLLQRSTGLFYYCNTKINIFLKKNFFFIFTADEDC